MSRKPRSTFLNSIAEPLHEDLAQASAGLPPRGRECLKDASPPIRRRGKSPYTDRRRAKQHLAAWLRFGFDLLLVEEDHALPAQANALAGWNRCLPSIDFICITRTLERLAVNIEDANLSLGARNYRSRVLAAIGAADCTVAFQRITPTLRTNLRLLTATLESGPRITCDQHLRAGLGLCLYLSDGRTSLGVGARRVAEEQNLSQQEVIGLAYWLIARRLWVVDLTKPLSPDHPVAFTKRPETAEDIRIKLESQN